MDRCVYQVLASALQARRNCAAVGNTAWFEGHGETIRRIERECLPSGSGFDSGTQVDIDECRDDRLVLKTAFHHMDEHGGYCGWTEHTVIVTPSFDSFDLRITGRDRRGWKEYAYEVFRTALMATYKE